VTQSAGRTTPAALASDEQRRGQDEVSADEWGELNATGDRVNPRDIINHLLIVWVVEYVPHSPTKFTRPDKPSDVIVVDVCDLDTPDADGYQGLLSRRVWWRQARIISMLRDKLGQRMLCRMTQGTASTGFNAPFQLINMKSDPEARQRGEQWLAAHPDFVMSAPSGKSGPLPGSIGDIASNTVTLNPTPVASDQKTMLERMAEQAQRGADRLPPPPPPPPGIPF